MYNPIQVVNKFIQLANDSGRALTHMQIQKLLYIAHGFSLAFYNKPLLSDPVCAWKYGPVIPSVYSTLRNYGAGNITQPVGFSTPDVDEGTSSFLKMIYDTYGKLSAFELSEFTHRANTPWSVTWQAQEEIINDNLIKEYYQRLLAKDAACIGL